MSEDNAAQTPPASSTLADPFAHYVDRTRQIVLRQDARLFSNSEVQTAKRCRRKWWLAWYRGLRFTRERPIGPRAVGDRVHRALARWYVPEADARVDPRQALEQLIQDDIQQVIHTHHQTGAEESEIAALLVALKKDADLERAMVEGYVQWLEETGSDANLTVLGSETYQDAQVPLLSARLGVAVYIIAKLDARVRRESDGAVLFMDHKTVADFAGKVIALAMDEQMLTYDLIATLNDIETHERPGGALYNMLRRVKRTVKAKPPFYQRVELRHNRHELESFYERLWGTLKDIIRMERRLDDGESHRIVAYPTPTGTCHWDCDFFLICPRFDDGSRVEDMLTRYYTRGDPLSYYYKDLILTKEKTHELA